MNNLNTNHDIFHLLLTFNETSGNDKDVWTQTEKSLLFFA